MFSRSYFIKLLRNFHVFFLFLGTTWSRPAWTRIKSTASTTTISPASPPSRSSPSWTRAWRLPPPTCPTHETAAAIIRRIMTIMAEDMRVTGARPRIAAQISMRWRRTTPAIFRGRKGRAEPWSPYCPGRECGKIQPPPRKWLLVIKPLLLYKIN